MAKKHPDIQGWTVEAVTDYRDRPGFRATNPDGGPRDYVETIAYGGETASAAELLERLEKYVLLEQVRTGVKGAQATLDRHLALMNARASSRSALKAIDAGDAPGPVTSL